MLLVSTAPGLRTGDDDPQRAACEYGPLATRRRRMAAACRCAACALGPWADRRGRKLLEVGLAYAGRTAPLAAVRAALRDADTAAAEVGRRAASDTWSVFEGLRAGGATADARAFRTVTGAVRWALDAGGAFPPMPPGWDWPRAAMAEAAIAPTCDPAWRTTDALALARLVRAGETDALPILADALQDAGCDDEYVLGHCREPGPHSPDCWVPDLILDAE